MTRERIVRKEFDPPDPPPSWSAESEWLWRISEIRPANS